MMSIEKILTILLRITAGVLLLAIVPIFFPRALMSTISRAMGVGELPDTAIFEYHARSLSALYAFHGAIVLFLSLDVRRRLPVIKFFAAVAVVFGIFMLSLDIYLRMPLPWIVCEGPVIIVNYAVILVLARMLDGR